MDLSIPYFVYCERASWMFLEQPLNVLSNTAFFVCAGLIWKDDEGKGTSLSLLAMLMAIAGFSGMLWHASERQIGLGFDIGAMVMLGGVLATVLANQILNWPPVNAIMVGIIIVLMSLMGQDLGLPFLLQKGGGFLPMMVFLVLLAFYKLQKGHQRPAKYLLSSAYLLFIALIFRSLDWPLCGSFGLGMHWLWQILFAVSAYLAIEAIHKNREIQASPSVKE